MSAQDFVTITLPDLYKMTEPFKFEINKNYEELSKLSSVWLHKYAPEYEEKFVKENRAKAVAIWCPTAGVERLHPAMDFFDFMWVADEISDERKEVFAPYLSDFKRIIKDQDAEVQTLLGEGGKE